MSVIKKFRITNFKKKKELLRLERISLHFGKRKILQDLTFNFCKTGARTVDIFVWHMLTFCQMIKEDFTCSRDWWYWEKPVPIQIVEEAAQLEAKEIKEFGVDAEKIYLGNGSTGRRIKIGGTA